MNHVDCLCLRKVSLRNLNSLNVKYMQNMFSNCRNLKEVDFTNVNTEKVIDMSNMFY